MQSVDPTPEGSAGSVRSPFRILLIVIGLAIGVGLIVALAYPSRSKQRVASTPTLSPTSDETLSSAVDALRRSGDLESCHTAVQQANVYLTLHESERPRELSTEERDVLKKEFGLEPDELAEIDHRSFQPLDAPYLESCFLLREATRALKLDKLSPVEQVAAAFAWVTRQVRLREPPNAAEGAQNQRQPDAAPPLFVLRRGWGSALERGLVFLAMLDQLGIDRCIVAVPAGAEAKAGARPWLVGALIGKEIYLFDARLGLPLPGPKGQGIATLAQVRTQSEILHILEVDPHFPYDLTPALVKQAEVQVACQLSALAPRMLLLQETLSSSGDKINLWTNPVEVLQRFHEAAGSKVHVWNPPGDRNNSLRVLRTFMPKEEGGVDEDGLRIQRAIAQLVPRQYLPRQVQPANLPGEAGERLRQLFANPFIFVGTKTRMPRDLMTAWLPGLAEERSAVQVLESGAGGEGQGQRINSQIIARGRLPRDLILHGRFDEATTLLVAIRREMLRQRAFRQDPALENMANEWRLKATAAYSALLQAQQRKAKGDPTADAALKLANQNVGLLWAESQAVVQLVQAAAAGPMSGEITYQLALCKHEQAEQARAKLELDSSSGKSVPPAESKAVRDAWRAAASWWQTYLDEQRNSPDAPSARRLRAQALEAMGDRGAAVTLLENQSGDLPSLEKTARLYLAKRLK
jgi:hypothetical protein